MSNSDAMALLAGMALSATSWTGKSDGICSFPGLCESMFRSPHACSFAPALNYIWTQDLRRTSLVAWLVMKNKGTVYSQNELYMIPTMRSLTAEEYVQAFKSFLDHSTEHQCMEQFINKEMPKILASLGNGKSTINVLGVGSGTGEQDLKMIKIMQAQHPGVLINNEVIEPNPQHAASYKALINKSTDLQNVSFIWHQITSTEYEQQVKEKNAPKKFDFIHMIQVAVDGPAYGRNTGTACP